MTISAVIPTRNRRMSLERTLKSLVTQTRTPDEIIVIDASDDTSYWSTIKSGFSGSPIRWIGSVPGVCLQRNEGIRRASGTHVLLCDDDIELEANYLESLEEYLARHPECGVAAGRLLQYERDGWVDQYPVKGAAELWWRFLFQLTIWGEIDRGLNGRPLFYRWIKRFYRRRGNTTTLAGWPLVTLWEGEAFQTVFYSLGANLVRKDWLSDPAFDEVLDRYGIGDNYGVAMRFPGPAPIHVLASTRAYHHRAGENRLSPALAYYRRILALHYFLGKQKTSFVTRAFFVWSLLGNMALFLAKGNFTMLGATGKAVMLIGFRRNPYRRGEILKKKTVEPIL